MKFKVEIDIMPLEALLDPQGKAVTSSMKNIGLPEVNNIRIGKHISLEVNAINKSEAEKKVNTACEKLLVNKIMENYNFVIKEI